MHRCQLHYLYIVLAVHLLTGASVSDAFGQNQGTIRIEDIIAGIESRDSALHSYVLEYEISTEMTDAFFRTEMMMSLVKEGKPIQEALKEAKTCPIEKAVEKSKQARKRIVAYDVAISDQGQIATTTYESDELLRGTRKKRYQLVFDGVKVRNLDLRVLAGGVGLTARKDCFPPQSPETCLYFLNKPLLELLRGGKVEVLGTRVVAGDILCDLRYRFPASDEGERVAQITFNMSKSVWPVSIKHTMKSGKSERTLALVEVEKFLKSGSFYYPGAITWQSMLDDHVFSSDNVTEITKCVVNRFELNPPLPADTFVLEFPKKTAFLDHDSKQQYVVNDEGKTLTLEEYQREQEAKREGARKSIPDSGGPGRPLVLCASRW